LPGRLKFIRNRPWIPELDKFFAEFSLLEQKFVKNPDLSIQDLLNDLIAKMGENITVKRFARFQVGTDA
jgi:elongation factor Ts